MAEKKRAADLIAGDKIDPPAGERSWLWRDGTKRQYTVTEVVDGRVDKGGLWKVIKATVASPYGEQTTGPIKCSMRPDKMIAVNAR